MKVATTTTIEPDAGGSVGVTKDPLADGIKLVVTGPVADAVAVIELDGEAADAVADALLTARGRRVRRRTGEGSVEDDGERGTQS